MESILTWGLDIIRFVQQMESPFMTFFMEFISFLGSPAFYLIIIALFYWCIDSAQGFKLGFVILFSGAFNESIKQSLQIPRPFVQDESVFIVKESGYSTPSGHSQGSAAFYPVLAKNVFRKKNAKNSFFKIFVAVFCPLLIGFSRVYLGVHYPSDVFLGWIIGFLTSVGIILFWDVVAKKFVVLPRSIKLLLVTALTFIFNGFCKEDVSLSALFFGFCVGKILIDEKGVFDASFGTLLQKIIRFIVGFVILALIFIILKIFSDFLYGFQLENNYDNLIGFIRYGVLGFSATFLIPVLFCQMKLGKSFTEKNNSSDISED